MPIVIRLDKLLASRKISSQELAGYLGCSVQTVSKIKNGRIKALRIETIDKICGFFGCQPDEFLEYMTEEEIVQTYGQGFLDEYIKYLSE